VSAGLGVNSGRERKSDAKGREDDQVESEPCDSRLRSLSSLVTAWCLGVRQLRGQSRRPGRGEDEEQLEQLEPREERAGEPEAAAGADDAAYDAVVAHDADQRSRGRLQRAADHRRHLVWHMVLQGPDPAEVCQQEGVRVSLRCSRLHILR